MALSWPTQPDAMLPLSHPRPTAAHLEVRLLNRSKAAEPHGNKEVGKGEMG